MDPLPKKLALFSHFSLDMAWERIKASVTSDGWIFPPKSDQFQISPAASPVLLHHTVWRTWLSIHSLLRLKDDYTTNSNYRTHTFLFKRLGECTFWSKEWSGVPLYESCVWTFYYQWMQEERHSRIVYSPHVSLTHQSGLQLPPSEKWTKKVRRTELSPGEGSQRCAWVWSPGSWW